jgi:hypothetical protein
MEQTDAYAVLREALAGRRPVDEATRRSVVLMTERLEQLRQSHPLLAEVGFSPEMQRLAERSGVVMVS